jgi:hypothetical protein
MSIRVDHMSIRGIESIGLSGGLYVIYTYAIQQQKGLYRYIVLRLLAKFDRFFLVEVTEPNHDLSHDHS